MGSDGDPDARFVLANERTFLAYVRTALALLAGGVAVDQLDSVHAAVRYVVSALLIALALACAGLGYRRWQQVDTALRQSAAMPATRLPGLLASGVVLGCVAAAVVVAAAH
jgi:inner membrane protein YidH